MGEAFRVILLIGLAFPLLFTLWHLRRRQDMAFYPRIPCLIAQTKSQRRSFVGHHYALRSMSAGYKLQILEHAVPPLGRVAEYPSLRFVFVNRNPRHDRIIMDIRSANHYLFHRSILLFGSFFNRRPH